MHHITHNWAEHIAFGSASTQYPTSLGEVQDAVRAAEKVRAIGSRHSFNDIADTTGTMISLRNLPRGIEIDAAARTATVDGGITYSELAPVLDAAGWALFNLASAPDFSVVGAVSTATHGSGDANRNLAGSVAAIEIVTASGEVLRLKRGDAAFDGAVVSVGALGVVTAVTLDLVPRFEIRQDIYHNLPFESVAENFDALMGSAYSVSLFTHWNGDFVDQAWVKGLAGTTPSAELLGGKPAQRQSGPVMNTDGATITGQLGVLGSWYDRLPHFRIGVLPAIGPEYQSEFFVARADAPAALRAIKAIEAALHPALIVSEVRTVASDEFWLSMNYREDSVGLHFTWIRDWATVREALVVLEAALAPFRPRPHWGKLFLMPGTEVAARYPRIDDFRALAATHDPQGKFRNTFVDRFVFGA